MMLLDHSGGHHLTKGASGRFRRPFESKVGGRLAARLVRHLLVHIPEQLAGAYHMQGGHISLEQLRYSALNEVHTNLTQDLDYYSRLHKKNISPGTADNLDLYF